LIVLGLEVFVICFCYVNSLMRVGFGFSSVTFRSRFLFPHFQSPQCWHGRTE